MLKHAKKRVEEFCKFEVKVYSKDIFNQFDAMELMQFERLEDCFKLAINVYEMDQDSGVVRKIRSSDKLYENVINIFEYKHHAMYITDLDKVLGKYPCVTCEAVLDTAQKLHDHKRNKCQLAVIERFVKKPKMYIPSKNRMKYLLEKYHVSGTVVHYIDHFIVNDFEYILVPMNDSAGANTKFTKPHQAVSVSICDCLLPMR
ncbi:unnamed protein product [Phytophthora lilii]|uniref:Unnamed protein product n=1 Tax=Phytophthora lilii TaxID=2077276 RepID=A0A9W7CIP1_9STRA|nr:unnamed protein product [Phytophthora lilii]